ncbi:MAG: cell envelope integrity protein CreD [Alphaproteobacteria bacterium]|nr:cell envelope integrity protein CreD [Alphaproteobacteria bacterium]
MDLRASSEARSLGLKLILVGALAFLLWIPAMLVYALIWDRSTRADEVKTEIYQLAGGRQTISGPIILAPGVIDTGKTDKDGAAITRTTVVAFTPQTLSIDAPTKTSVRRRSIYEATIFDADIVMKGRFGALKAPRPAEGVLSIDWDRAVLAVKFSSGAGLKGVREALQLKLNGRPVRAAFEPGFDTLRGLDEGPGTASFYATGISAALPIDNPQNGFSFELALPLSGGGALYFAPVGEQTSVSIKADWPDPSFQGAYLPDTRKITDKGFSAQWRIPYLARGLPRSFVAQGNLDILDQGKSFGVEFIATASPYQSVSRALKYALMFLGIVFLTFFLFEATMGARAHPAQYILLGATQVIFYLLVLAFSEHIGFGPAFALTAGATVLLTGYYAATVFRSLLHGLIAFTAFSGAYGLIYLLMKSEDYALLIGSVTAFGAIALTMFITRNLDWYGARIKE